jgi:eukaryotic-like serine/threonine-protein kinase
VYAALPAARLFRRSMSDMEVRPIRGTEGYQRSTDPVFSPDGRWIAFYAQADQTIKKVPISGGAAITVCAADQPLGLFWGADGIMFGQAKGIMRVSPDGGKPNVIVRLQDGELAHNPQLLPGGKHLLFAVTSGTGANRWDRATVVAQSLASGERKALINGGSDARYVNTGQIVYVVDGRLFASSFDLERLEVKGNPVLMVEGLSQRDTTGAAQYSVSANGSLVYMPVTRASSRSGRQLALVTRNGEVENLKLPPGPYMWPRVSPDGTHVAFGIDEGPEATIWVYDLSGATEMRRLTFGSNNRYPVWSADSKHVVFQSDRARDLGMFRQRADGTGTAERLTQSEHGTSHVPESWSPRGNILLYSVTKGSDISLWMFSLSDRSVTPFGNVHSSIPSGAVFSPDGRWVAYTSSQNGSATVYTQPYPATGATYQLLAKGSDSPHEVVWAPDGKELFYNPRPRGFEAVPVNTRPTFTFGRSVAVARPFVLGPPEARRTYDITHGGKFIGLISEGYGTAPQIRVVLNWSQELQTRLPAAR